MRPPYSLFPQLTAAFRDEPQLLLDKNFDALFEAYHQLFSAGHDAARRFLVNYSPYQGRSNHMRRFYDASQPMKNAEAA